MANEWGPLAGLIGEWEGTGGLDTAYSHSQGKVLGTPYKEKVTMKPMVHSIAEWNTIRP